MGAKEKPPAGGGGWIIRTYEGKEVSKKHFFVPRRQGVHKKITPPVKEEQAELERIRHLIARTPKSEQSLKRLEALINKMLHESRAEVEIIVKYTTE